MINVPSFIHSRVARRIFLLFVISALLPVCLLALVSVQRVSSRLQIESRERLRQIGKNAGMAIHEGFVLLQAELESMSLQSAVDRERIQPAGPRLLKDKRFRTVHIADENGIIGNISGTPRRLSPAEHAHLSAGNALILADGKLGVKGPIYMATIFNRNLPRHALLVGEINPDYLWTLVGYTLPPAIDLCVLGPSGKPQYSTRNLPPALASIAMKYREKASIGHFEWKGENEDYLANYWTVFLKPAFLTDSWTVVALQSKRDSMGPARSFINTFLLVILLTLFVVVFVSSILIRRSLVPLSILKEGSRRISKGDFESRVEIASGDEFEDLALSFNEMSEKLGKQFNSLSEMGGLVRRILEANDRETIISGVLSRFRNSVPCEWLGISLFDIKNTLKVLTFYNNAKLCNSAETMQFETLLSETELEAIRAASNSLHISGVRSFTSILAPMSAEGANEHFLFPISIKDRLLGILTLGYRQPPDNIREELVRARQIANEIAIALDNVRLIDELNLLNWGTIEALANAVDAKSPWTAGHSERVTRLALEIGKEMGFSKNDLDLLHRGGIFHDMGKIAVPEYILDKPGKLTDEEFALIKKHPAKGAEILDPIKAYHEAIPIVAQHHERFDGLGYPLGLAGEEISPGARVLAVADVFDALYSDRPYRKGWELDKVISYLEENAGSSFDPEVVKAFMRIDRAVYLKPSAEESLFMDDYRIGRNHEGVRS